MEGELKSGHIVWQKNLFSIKGEISKSWICPSSFYWMKILCLQKESVLCTLFSWYQVSNAKTASVMCVCTLSGIHYNWTKRWYHCFLCAIFKFLNLKLKLKIHFPHHINNLFISLAQLLSKLNFFQDSANVLLLNVCIHLI